MSGDEEGQRVFVVAPDITVTIQQQFMGDVNCVVWDSALVAVHSFVHQGSSAWAGKRVLELGSGTGVCGLVLAALGADVVLTDLPEYLPLLEKNIVSNSEQVAKNVSVKPLDWMVGDPATFSNFGEVVVNHYNIEWDVDFEAKRLAGNAVLTCKAEKQAQKIILDGRDLVIEHISMDGKDVAFNVTHEEVRGMKVVVETGTIEKGQILLLSIKYHTAAEARALQFLNKDQTTDKNAPYLFSQCQAIHARSILPCMDTPSVKASYNAKVTVPTGLTCLMSAIGEAPITNGDKTTFSFKQTVAIPSYLIAIVVGCLEKRDISERCAVWAEPSIVESALWEFTDTEKILKVAEDLAGPYVWGRYDMVVLPATFPFGGMENPCLTFITPTLLAGDRSLVNVVAHEISHSWTGNLVTNASWEHFWLNEGFTVFLERKIHGRMYGEAERQFESECGWEDALVPTVKKVFNPEHEFTKLVQNHKGIDPDDAFSSVPYEKGSAFLFYLEQALGDPQRFEQFLKSYIAKYAHKTVTTDVWKHELFEFFADRQSVLSAIDWDRWLHQPGIPPRPTYDTTLMKACRALSDQWFSTNPPTDDAAFVKMSPTQKVAVLSLLRSGKFDTSKMDQLTTQYKLAEAKNCEIQFNWVMLGLETKWEAIIPPAMSFVIGVGRLKYCKPIYKALFEWPITSTKAVEMFKNNIKFMHPITVNIISKLIPK